MIVLILTNHKFEFLCLRDSKNLRIVPLTGERITFKLALPVLPRVMLEIIA